MPANGTWDKTWRLKG